MQIQNAILTGSTTVYGPITFVSGTLAGSASYAATSSYADTFTVAGSLTAQTLVVQTITSSVSFITGSTRFGSLLTNTHQFTGSMFLTGSAITLNNGKALIGDDTTYGGAYQTLGFGGLSNGFNKIAASVGTADGLYLQAATGRGIALRPNGSTITTLAVTSTGRVGIGTNLLSPSALLHVSGSGSDPLMQISSTVSSSIFFVSGSGNVGIGTTSPTEKFDVIGGAVAAGNGTIRTGITYSTLGLIGTFTNHDLGVITNGTEKMRISSDGSMGFGRNVLASRSFVFQGLTSRPLVIEAVESANTHSIMMRPNNSGYNLISSNYLVGSTYLPLSLSGRENTSDFVLATNGKVGIGTSSPAFTLDVSGTGRFTGAITIGTDFAQLLPISALNSQFLTGFYYDGSNLIATAASGTRTIYNSGEFTFSNFTGATIGNSVTDTERMRITSSGSLTIGTSEVVGSNSKLVVSSSDAGPSFINQTQGQQNLLCWNKATSGDNLWVEFHAGSSLGVKGSIDYNRASNLTRYNTTSDANLKNIIGDSNKEKSIGILTSTKIREYSWKDDTTNKSQIGVIAQELYQTFKGAVSVGSDESLLGTEGYKPWAVDKTAFTFHLIAGWQEHERIIQELSTKLEEATTRIKTL